MGKTVTTYLIDGDPKGTRYSFIKNKICQMFVIPRSDLEYLNQQEMLHTPAFYILLGEDDSLKPKAYIGETENFKERVKDHDLKKTFWQRANENKQTPKAPNLPEYQRDAMDEFFDDIQFLASFVGCNIFEILERKAEHLFFTKGRGCESKGYYGSDGFTVLMGSVISPTSAPSLKWGQKRQKMLAEYTIEESGKLIMTSNKTFTSPSAAADFCIGSSNNGWIVWKDAEGNTLDAIYRKPLD